MDNTPTDYCKLPFSLFKTLYWFFNAETSGLVMFFHILDDLVEHFLAKSWFQCPDEGLVGIQIVTKEQIRSYCRVGLLLLTSSSIELSWIESFRFATYS